MINFKVTPKNLSSCNFLFLLSDANPGESEDDNDRGDDVEEEPHEENNAFFDTPNFLPSGELFPKPRLRQPQINGRRIRSFWGMLSGSFGRFKLDDSLSASSPESSIDEPSRSKQAELVDEQSSGSVSPGSRTSEPQLTDKVESSSPQNMENYTNIGM
ncbi:hypothetical protein HanRHA438_Chr12g0556991 [Helianthus annuus]|nr:hypothetical protein HanHA300_Chr12g0447101 [Helianthus annuus]KAJ0505626.1 hypothetical protein HanHA89_Chr12g0472631 [Helianthus annuus]KAJ0675291.1 hypothetical protein HanLR1_Chr12g0449531 [Helianthus annuus]KAJ0866897.1 hypothetical protein HanRHA438_Chr12g0556991 [Helianthus annuus]